MKIIMALSTILVLIIIGCDTPAESVVKTSPVEASIIKDSIMYTLYSSHKVFNVTDTISGRFTVTNQTGGKKRFEFTNMEQWGFKLYDDEGTIAFYHPRDTFPAVSYFELENNQTKEFLLFATFTDPSGNYIIRKSYILAAYLLINNSPRVELDITVQ